jgi:hypothetical protein
MTNKHILGKGMTRTSKQINRDLAKLAGLVNCGKDNEGNDEYMGTDMEWKTYESLEENQLTTEDLVDIADGDLDDKLRAEDQDNLLD